ncbi:MAG: hypothetical protein QMD46_00305 [Methanomicrobiales archaeon]|nr:hypothetical protein [Methanomicrobiales archaeon]
MADKGSAVREDPEGRIRPQDAGAQYITVYICREKRECGMLPDRIGAHLDTIERVHGIVILNREEIVRRIADGVRGEQQVLPAMTALNTWVAVEGLTGAVDVPPDVLEKILFPLRGERDS